MRKEDLQEPSQGLSGSLVPFRTNTLKVSTNAAVLRPRRRKDVTVRIGLTASYDRIRRFDLADRAYAQATRLGGVTVQILNDQGYSCMLRGNQSAARRKFEQGYSMDPGNPVIANNLELLNGSRRFIERQEYSAKEVLV
jgi:Flp pilus assembly protein TadD